MTGIRYVLGIDVGQANDPTALALIEHSTDDDTTYNVRALHRFRLGTSYPHLVEQVGNRLTEPPLARRTRTAIDATGVGAPIVDLFRQHERFGAEIYAITITAGANVGGGGRNPTVPKRDLITATALLLQQGRLRIAANLEDTHELIDQLRSYRVKISDSGHDSYGPANSRDHDDLLLALSLALWLAESKKIRYGSISAPTGMIPGARITGRPPPSCSYH